MQDRASFAQELAVYFSTSDNTWIILSRRDTCDGTANDWTQFAHGVGDRGYRHPVSGSVA